MALKVGNIVNHACALEWGAGKVMEVTPTVATIQFSDGKNRKISVSFFGSLQPAPPGEFIPHPDVALEVKALKAPRAARKKKLVV